MAKAGRLSQGYPKILAAVTRLNELHQVLKAYGTDRYVSFELGVVSSYQYYTGIIFAGYTFGSGEPILKGGRYDRLLSHFGKQAASIGFAVVIDQLMASLARQKIAVFLPEDGEVIVYAKERFLDAVTMAKEIRKKGGNVELIGWDSTRTKEEYASYAKRTHRRKTTFLE